MKLLLFELLTIAFVIAQVTSTSVESPEKAGSEAKHGEASAGQNKTKSREARQTNKKLVVCYFTSWGQYKSGIGAHYPKNTPVKLCTHIIYSFFYIYPSHKLDTREWNDEASIKKLRQKITDEDPGTKLMVAVGGWTHPHSIWSNMVETQANRKIFIDSVMKWVEDLDLDGLDLDWEFPEHPHEDFPPRTGQEKKDFTFLCKELRAAFDTLGKKTGKTYLLSAAVSASPKIVPTGYEHAKIANYLDWIGVMTYDLRGHWDGITGSLSPLHSYANDPTPDLTTEWGMKEWEKNGVPSSKLAVGFAMYGKSFVLADPANHGLFATSVDYGSKGQYTLEKGTLSYYEICLNIAKKGWTRVYDATAMAPYAYGEGEWAGYEDDVSMAEKVKWTIAEKYAGGIVWSLELDDFNQACPRSKRPYPLLSVIYEGFNGGQAAPGVNYGVYTTKKYHVPGAGGANQNTPAAGGSLAYCSPVCPKKGGHTCFPDDIYNYYTCSNGQPSQPRPCPPNTAFDEFTQSCVWPNQVKPCTCGGEMAPAAGFPGGPNPQAPNAGVVTTPAESWVAEVSDHYCTPECPNDNGTFCIPGDTNAYYFCDQGVKTADVYCYSGYRFDVITRGCVLTRRPTVCTCALNVLYGRSEMLTPFFNHWIATSVLTIAASSLLWKSG